MGLIVQSDNEIEMGETVALILPSDSDWNGRTVALKPMDGIMTALFLACMVALLVGIGKINSLSGEVMAIGSVCIGVGLLVSLYYLVPRNSD